MIAPAVDMSSLNLFYRDVRRLERLSADQELALARRWHASRDLEAARELVCANLYAVAGIAREYRHFGLPEMDLIQEGTLGLMHAVKRFDPERGFRLITYAAWWVRAAIHDFILRSWSIVKLGTSKVQRKVFAGLRQAKTAIAAMEGHGADEVAAELGISGEQFKEVAHAYLARDLSLDAACPAAGGYGRPGCARARDPDATAYGRSAGDVEGARRAFRHLHRARASARGQGHEAPARSPLRLIVPRPRV